jgi:hypothetical protein
MSFQLLQVLFLFVVILKFQLIIYHYVYFYHFFQLKRRSNQNWHKKKISTENDRHETSSQVRRRLTRKCSFYPMFYWF